MRLSGWALGLVVALGAAGAGLSPAAGAPRGRLVVTPTAPVVGEAARIELRLASTKLVPRRRPVVTAAFSGQVVGRFPLTRVGPRLWRGSFVFRSYGNWSLSTLVRGVVVVQTLVVRLPPRPSFEPPGQPGCDPPSPANSLTLEVRGTATVGDLWALLFGGSLANPSSAVLDGVLGKQEKIVWRLRGRGDVVFTATAPDGVQVAPFWLQEHGGSTWTRPGDEWGTGFVFSQTGCWRIHAQRSDVSGDVWMIVRS